MGAKRVEPETLRQYRLVSDPAVHPAGHMAAYLVKEIHPVNNEYRTYIRGVSLDGDSDTLLTEGDKDSAPQWSPDGSRLGFMRDAGDGRQVWAVSPSGKEPVQLTHAKRGVLSFSWSPDSRMIAYTAKVSNDNHIESLPPEQAKSLENSLGRAYERTIPKAEGAGWWDGLYSHLFLLYTGSGKVVRLTSGKYNAAQPAWSPNGRELAFLTKIVDEEVQDPDLLPFNDLYTMDLTDMRVRKRSSSTLNISQFTYSSDGSAFALIGDDRTYGSGTHNRLYALPAEGGTPEAFHAETEMQLGNFVLNDVKSGMAAPGPLYLNGGTDLYALGTSQGGVHLYRFVRNEAPVALTAGELDIHQISAAADGPYVVAAAMDKSGPAELIRVDTRTGEVFELTNMNKTLMGKLHVILPEPVAADTADGYKIHGWVMKPQKLAEGQKVPLILVIHGGPHAMYAPAYSHELQVLAAEGYAVLFANPRGSFGYGQDFAKACRGDFGNGDYQDLMDIVDAAVANYSFIDENRLGVMGGSYGGLMTNWIAGHTTRFRAAVSQRGISNWLSFYGLSDIGITYTEGIAGGNPWDHAELLWSRSPLAYVNQVRIPMLIMHGEQDLRCPVGQSDEWYTALKRLGNPARLLRYPGSGHMFLKLGKPSYRVQALQEVNSWFKQYLTGGDEMKQRMQLPLPLALLLENVRSSGMPEQTVIDSLRTKDFSAVQSLLAEPGMDTRERAQLAEDMHVDWKQAVREGYEFGFLHTNGLKKLLRFRFRLIENEDYVQEGASLKGLELTREQAETLHTLIYRQWNVVEEGPAAGEDSRNYTLQSKSELV